jgi:serine/threonine-protein kinase RsbW
MRSDHWAAQAQALAQPVSAVDVSLAAVPDAARAARSAVSDAFTGQVDDGVLEDAQLVVVELVTNSVRHAGLTADDIVRVGGEVNDGVLRLEVDNPGCAGTIALQSPDMLRGGGFGLLIVDTIAHAWGVSRGGDTRVWAELICWPATG